MTSSEVMMLQRELHKLSEQNREDHKAVREALGQLQGDLNQLNKRLGAVEAEDYADEQIEAFRKERRRQLLASASAIAAVAGVISGLVVAFIH